LAGPGAAAGSPRGTATATVRALKEVHDQRDLLEDSLRQLTELTTKSMRKVRHS